MKKFTHNDIRKAFEYLSDSDVMKYIEAPFTYETAVKFIEQFGISEHPFIYALFEKETSELIGHTIFHPFDDDNNQELGIIMGKKYQGKGYALEIGKAIIDYAFSVIKCDKVYAETTPKNNNSIALIVKLGMKYDYTQNNLMVFSIAGKPKE